MKPLSAYARSLARTAEIQWCIEEARADGNEALAERAEALLARELALRDRLTDLRHEVIFGVIGVEEWALDESADRSARKENS